MEGQYPDVLCHLSLMVEVATFAAVSSALRLSGALCFRLHCTGSLCEAFNECLLLMHLAFKTFNFFLVVA